MRWGKGVEVEGTGAFAVGLKLRSFGLLRTPQDDNGFFCGAERERIDEGKRIDDRAIREKRRGITTS
jgi:hypothetical protein